MHIRHGKIYGFTEVGEKFVSDERYERKYYVFCKCTYRSKMYHYLNYAASFATSKGKNEEITSKGIMKKRKMFTLIVTMALSFQTR